MGRLKAGNDNADDGKIGHVRWEIDAGDLIDTHRAQPVHQPIEIFPKGRGYPARYEGEIMQRRSTLQERPSFMGFLRPALGHVFFQHQVVARTGNIVHPRLHRLGQRSREGHPAISVGSRTNTDVTLVIGFIGDEAIKCGDADIRGRIPQGHLQSGSHNGMKNFVRGRAIDLRQVNHGRGALTGR